MEYKTTYFTLSVNREVSINSEEYYYRSNKEQLLADIASKEKNENLVKGKSIAELEELFLERYTHSGNSDNLRRLILLKKMLENFDDKRFTENDQVLLNEHIIKISGGGWKLHSMQPIIKGLNYSYNKYENSYGYGHDVTEGFVMVWEKI